MKRLLKKAVGALVVAGALAVGASVLAGEHVAFSTGQVPGGAAAGSVPVGFAGTDGAGDADDDADDDAVPCEPGTALVMLAEGADPDATFGRIAGLPETAGVGLERVTGNCMKLSLPADISVEEALTFLADVEGVAFAQPNYRYHVLDPSGVADTVQTLTAAALSGAGNAALSTQVAANDSRVSSQWALSSINAPEAWDEVTKLGASHKRVSVVVLDSGFLVSHEDLKGVVARSYNAVKGGSSVYNTASNATHGTHVAGIIAAQANNGKGIAGVAYNTSSFSTCKLIPVQVANSRGAIYTDTLVDAYNWLRKKRAAYNIRVVNMSLGGDRSAGKNVYDTLLERAINAAWNDGIVTVAAAANIDDGQYYTPFATWPSDSPNVVSVIDLTRSSGTDGVVRSLSSNFNRVGEVCKDISAPGSGILSTYSNSTSSYAKQSGTSMAAPAVAGVLALEFKARPKLTAPEATSKLFSAAKDLTETTGASAGWDRVTGYGEVNAAAAVSETTAYLSGATSVSAGGYTDLSVKIAGGKRPASAWSWSSGNPSVARVTSAGRVIGVSAGDAVITATNGAATACQTVTVSGARTHVSSLAIKVAGRAYTGKARKPAPVVRDGSARLVKGRDYKVSYSNNRKVGLARVKVTGRGSYYGSTTVRFAIRPKATSITSIKRASRGFSVKWKRRSAQTTGYQLQIAMDKGFSSGAYTFRKANPRAVGASIGKLKAGKRYYVRVRSYKLKGGVTYYSSWSKTRSVRTR